MLSYYLTLTPMAFVLAKGSAKVEWYPKKASQVMAVGDLLYADGSGAVQIADATSGNHIGVCMKTIAATDSDYASTTMIPVLVPNDSTEWDVSVGTGTLTTAMVGNFYDLADETGIDVTAQSKNVVQVTKFISASKARVKINAMAANANVATT